MSVSSDEVNFLVYRYLLESGFSHSAFTFSHESLVSRSVVADSEVPPGALIAFLQKGLQYCEIETHLQEDGTERPCDEPFHLLAPHICRLKYTTAAAAAGKKAAAAAAAAGEGGSLGGSLSVVPEIAAADVMVLKGHTSEVFACQFHPTRPELLATGSGDGTGRIWRLNERLSGGDPAVTILRHASSGPKGRDRDVASIDWSPDGLRLATGCYDSRARIWSADSGSLQHVLTGHSQPILSLQFNPSGTHVVTASVDKTAMIWDASSGNSVATYSFHSAAILDVDWQSDTTFAACSSDKTITLCSLSDSSSSSSSSGGGSSSRPLRTFAGHKDEVNSIQWSPNKQILASASDDNTCKLWSPSASSSSSSSSGSGSGGDGCVATLTGHKKSVYSVRWAPTGEGSKNPNRDPLLATASLDGTVRVWEPYTPGGSSSSSSGAGSSASAGAGSGTAAGAGTGASASSDRRLRYTLSRHSGMVYALAFSPDGSLMVSGSTDKTVFVWRTSDGSLVRSYVAGSGLYDLSFNATGDKIACACANSSVSVLDLRM